MLLQRERLVVDLFQTVNEKDETGNNAGIEPYEISFEVVNEEAITNFYPYPNPFSDILYINSTEKNISKLEIYSILGKRLNLIKSNFEEINTSNLTKGTYLIKIYLKDKVLSKIILKK